MLAQAMASTDDAEQEDEPETEALPETRQAVAVVEAVVSPVSLVASASGPPAKYQELYAALIVQDRWPVSEAQQIARKHGQMLSGALDVLNEWAMEAYGGQVFFEESDSLVVERSLLT
jgi:hypothetical protein